MRHKIATNSERRRWLVLAVTVAAQFMVIVDIAVVNVALPAIKHDLHFSAESLQWVITAYSILFGGTLLLGGRLADVLGRRRLFMAGVAVFTRRLVAVRARLVGNGADRHPRAAGTRRRTARPGRALDRRHHVPPRDVSGTSPSACGALPPAAVAPSACCSAASSRRT